MLRRVSFFFLSLHFGINVRVVDGRRARAALRTSSSKWVPEAPRPRSSARRLLIAPNLTHVLDSEPRTPGTPFHAPCTTRQAPSWKTLPVRWQRCVLTRRRKDGAFVAEVPLACPPSSWFSIQSTPIFEKVDWWSADLCPGLNFEHELFRVFSRPQTLSPILFCYFRDVQARAMQDCSTSKGDAASRKSLCGTNAKIIFQWTLFLEKIHGSPSFIWQLLALKSSVPSAVAPKEHDASSMRARTIVTFADLYRESPGVVTSTESSFVVLIDEGKCTSNPIQ
jgi:hypothetical protein